MEALIKIDGIAAPLDRANVDTDQIIPKQFLKKIDRAGFGVHLFHDWRFLDPEGKRENPEFVLNAPKYKGARILLARENFGCGSSREHAPWALEDYGFRVVIAPSFADIFYNNCFKNGMLPIILKTEEVEKLFEYAKKDSPVLHVDLEKQKVEIPGGASFSFEVDPFRKECLLKGLDDIGLTLQHEREITKFEESYKKNFGFYGLSS